MPGEFEAYLQASAAAFSGTSRSTSKRLGNHEALSLKP